MTVKLIAHTLTEKDGKVSAHQTLENKAGLPNVYPSYWDIQSGKCRREWSREAALREVIEEVNQKLRINKIILKIVNLMPAKICLYTPSLCWRDFGRA